MSIQRLAQAAGARVAQAGRARDLQAAGTDTRRLKKGSLFIALGGRHAAGERYFGEALRRGAAALLGRSFPQAIRAAARRRGAWLLQAADGLAALQALGRDQRSLFHGPVAAITGSNGKTGAKDLAAHVLGLASPGLATQGNFNNHLGLPLTLLGLRKEDRWMALELGMNHAGEMLALARLCKPTHAVVLNVGDAHLGHFRDRRAVAAAKEELLRGMGAGGTAVLNAADPLVREMGRRFRGRVVWFGKGAGQGLELTRLRDRGAGGLKATALWRRQGRRPLRFSVALAQGGRARRVQAEAALALGLELGLEPSLLARGLAGWEPSGGMRQEVRSLGKGKLILDAYNASPQSMQAALEFLALSAPRGARAAALGDMLELGAASPRFHREAGRQARAAGVRVLAAVGSQAGQVCRGFGGDCAAFAPGQQARAGAWLRARLREGDWVLVKGSRGSAMEKAAAALEAR